MSLLALVPLGVYDTEHDAEAPVPLRVQAPTNDPLPVVVNVTCPVGVMNVPGELSVTVTVQSVGTPMTAGDAQMTEADMDLPITVMLKVTSGNAAE